MSEQKGKFKSTGSANGKKDRERNGQGAGRPDGKRADARGSRPDGGKGGAGRKPESEGFGAAGGSGAKSASGRPYAGRSAAPAAGPERTGPGQRDGKRYDERAAGSASRGAGSGSPASGSASGRPHEGAKPYAAGKGQGKRTAAPVDAEQIKIGDRIVVTIKRIGINGEGVGYYRRKAVFVDGAITDEVIKAEVTETQEKFLKAKLIEVEKRSPDRVEPPCPVFGICGGCQIQHISYEGQLKAKLEIVREAFSRYAKLDNLKIKPTLGMDRPWDYRNKAQLQVERRDIKGGKVEIVAGLYEIGSHEIVDISGCPIQHPQVNRAIERVKAVLGELNIPLSKGDSRGGRSDIKGSGTRKGVRTIVARAGFQSGEIQVTLVTETADLPRQDELVERLRLELPEMSGLSINVNPLKTPLIFGEKTVNLWGSEAMKESLGDLQFELSPRAFFQLNPEQTIKLYETVRAAAALTGKETVVDAYCGTGTIGLWLAPYAAEVRGIEVIPEAVEDAQRNAELNGRGNAQFFEGEAEDLLPRWAKSGLTPDVIVADPPRTGLDRTFLDTVLRTKPKKFVYVSCNPSTLAKDCKVLLDGGYEIQSVQPVDMFPQTSQVEAVTVLVRSEA
ncbi:23S rRNA (uracil(1939)-C(5))-methyltransferase RlmD [Saccharibacillus alkalitolerans]|uniref:23S rRNA (Uracil(1939)-C(5))-methyltransferase RlmD n=1 Tax=Saccharibacillus alkalitolerans TaxID=2705290 RepID=A0ABX0F4G8_9BACL|nr:23S rRNA (uracil(1939)-C(5))-methyltransferase RlmD [Saccharibacillus alkalitolerans]NGZ75268.1 23S rRNA (uracil(1939)-C(5))-methyltransferase RlmD [Saccharibacillus alkalitolerans]